MIEQENNFKILYYSKINFSSCSSLKLSWCWPNQTIMPATILNVFVVEQDELVLGILIW